MDTIGFIGGGNMAEALIKGIIGAKVYAPENILVSDIAGNRLEYLAKQYSVTTTESNSRLAEKADIIVLSVKPQNISDALQSIKTAVDPDKLIISIAAGIKTKNISAVLGNLPIVRVMPNTPALIAQGASALFVNDQAKSMLRKAETIFSSVGKAVFVDDEEMIDTVTAVSGSGPAYFFLLIEEMIKAAIQLDMPEETAKQLVLQTAKGAALLAEEVDKKSESPADLRKKVTSPGGTTEAALKILTEGNFSKLVKEAVTKARDRSRELSNQ